MEAGYLFIIKPWKKERISFLFSSGNLNYYNCVISWQIFKLMSVYLGYDWIDLLVLLVKLLVCSKRILLPLASSGRVQASFGLFMKTFLSELSWKDIQWCKSDIISKFSLYVCIYIVSHRHTVCEWKLEWLK